MERTFLWLLVSNCYLGFASSEESTCSEQCDAKLVQMTKDLGFLRNQYDEVVQRLKDVEANFATMMAGKQGAKGQDCAELYQNGIKLSGVYTITPNVTAGRAFEVYCDMDTDGGGWTVFQKRVDGTVDFYRGWEAYKHGFGNLNSEFWLGNDLIYLMTNGRRYELRVDMEDVTGTKTYALYNFFAIESEKTNYKLKLGVYTGNAGDSLSIHNGYPFSTKDKENDSHSRVHCAQLYKGAWWYNSCHSSNLNGLYHLGPHTSYADGINWNSFKGYYHSLKSTAMKIRPIGFSTGSAVIG